MGQSKKWLDQQYGKAVKGGEVTKQKWELIKEEYNKNPSRCSQCNRPLEYTKRNNKFCCKSCSATYSNQRRVVTEEQKRKTSKKLFQGNDKKRKCIECGSNFISKYRKHRTTCSDECLHSRLVKAGNKGGRQTASNGSVRRSKNEIHFAELCKEKFRNVLTNEPIFNGWDADVILENEKIAILWNGIWHYKQLSFGNHKLKQVQYRDKIKLDEIKKSGYSYYIIKDMGGEDPSFVESEFKKFVSSL
jgi:hypothetical protein